MSSTLRRLNADEAASRLGVKKETLYAYVSRGMLTSERTADGRSSTFDGAEIERLAGKGRRTRGAGEVDVIIGTQLTRIADEQLWYRGAGATELARTQPFESVAEWLWTSATDGSSRWRADSGGLGAARAVVAALPPTASVFDRSLAITAAMAAGDPLRHDRRPEAVTAMARSLIAALVDAPRPIARGAAPLLFGTMRDSIAGRLWTRLSRHAPAQGVIEAVNTALVLTADHELAISTLAARVAASSRSDPYGVVAAGFGTLAGPLHGTASTLTHALLVETEANDGDAGPALGELLRRSEVIPGFGHKIYKGDDPRAVALLDALRRSEPPKARLAIIDAVLATSSRRVPVRPNIDFALAALCFCHDLPATGGEAIFGVARVAGWIAHAMEEYGEAPLRFRPRAHYVGRIRPS